MAGDLAIDLGSANTRVVDASGAVLVDEPTLAAVDVDTGRLVAFGREAPLLAAASAGRVSAVRPVRRGQLVDLELTDALLSEVLRRAGANRLARPRVLACASSAATPVQLRALTRSLRQAGARAVRFVDHALACAAGAGLPIDEPSGCMVVDVGAGTTEIGVLALGGLVASSVVPLGGDDYDDALRQLLVRRYDVLVDRRSLEAARVALGTVAPHAAGSRAAASAGAVELAARERSTGAPCLVGLDADEMRPALERVAQQILDAVVATITKAPPELANDLIGSGVQLAGGASRLHGFDRRLATATGLPVHVEDPELIALRGAARCLEEPVTFDVPVGAALRH